MRNFSIEILTHSFPKNYIEDTLLVAHYIPSGAYVDGSFCKYKLLSGEEIEFPYRIYGVEDIEVPLELTPVQKTIFHAFLSRSHNGFVREKHIREIFSADCPEWIFPYIVKLSDEYVIEIVELIYSQLKDKDCQKIKDFCSLNVSSFVRSYDRMASYWGNIMAIRFINIQEENFLENAMATKNRYGTKLTQNPFRN